MRESAKDLDHELSASVTICPSYGSSTASASVQQAQAEGWRYAEKRCGRCGSSRLVKVRALASLGEVWTVLALLCLGLIPGIVYFVYVTSRPYCASCERRMGARLR